MNAMVLAAGLGTRLGEIGRSVPKVLIEVGGRPLLARHLEYLEHHGISRVVINVYHLADRVEAFLDSYGGPLEIVCIREEQLLGTAGSVRNALSLLTPSPFLVLYGDVVIGESLAAMLEMHRRTQAHATLAVHPADSTEGKGVVDVAEGDRVMGFAEKEQGRCGAALINSGIYVIESDLVSQIPPGTFSDFGQDVFPAAVRRGLRISAFRLGSPVIDIGTMEGLASARRLATQAGSAKEGIQAEA